MSDIHISEYLIFAYLSRRNLPATGQHDEISRSDVAVLQKP